MVKVTDNALARDLFPGDYNCLGDNENRPVKWMAIEALQDKRFSTASDVVSVKNVFSVRKNLGFSLIFISLSLVRCDKRQIFPFGV